MAYAAGAAACGQTPYYTQTATILVLFILLTIIGRVIGGFGV
jgi:uncharacterized protein (TIGR01732 family)